MPIKQSPPVATGLSSAAGRHSPRAQITCIEWSLGTSLALLCVMPEAGTLLPGDHLFRGSWPGWGSGAGGQGQQGWGPARLGLGVHFISLVGWCARSGGLVSSQALENCFLHCLLKISSRSLSCRGWGGHTGPGLSLLPAEPVLSRHLMGRLSWAPSLVFSELGCTARLRDRER